MIEMLSFKDLLSGGADLAIMALVYIAWRLDRRLVAVEQKLGDVSVKFSDSALAMKQCPLYEDKP